MNNPNAGNQGQDYGDKAFGAVAKKFGGAQGQKVANNRAMSEKIVSPSKYARKTVRRISIRSESIFNTVSLDGRPAQGL
jgi:hypothetical protein